MHPIRKQRLLIVIFVVVLSSLIVGLISFALKENINLFYPPSALVDGSAPTNKKIRAGGCVKPGSVQRSKDSLAVKFLITDGTNDVLMEYEGILPDLFSEGEAIVAMGMLSGDGVFLASEVLAKHDETYTPPEVAEAVKDAQGHDKACEGMEY